MVGFGSCSLLDVMIHVLSQPVIRCLVCVLCDTAGEVPGELSPVGRGMWKDAGESSLEIPGHQLNA